jgi:hypothetical protein
MRFYNRLRLRLLRRPVESTQYTSLAFGGRCREAGGPPVDGQCGRCLRQRPLRELLRDARVRVAGSSMLPHPGRCSPGRVRLHRRLVQPAAPPFGARLGIRRPLERTSARNHAAGSKQETWSAGEPLSRQTRTNELLGRRRSNWPLAHDWLQCARFAPIITAITTSPTKQSPSVPGSGTAAKKPRISPPRRSVV